MVPGMAERERLAHDARRKEWLSSSNANAAATTPGASTLRAAYRLIAFTALGLSRRLRPAHRVATAPRPIALEVSNR